MKQKYYIYLVIGIFGISVSPIITRYATVPPLTIALYRMITVTIIMAIMYNKKLTAIKTVSGRTLKLSIINGVVLALHFITWFYAIQLTSVASAAVLVNLHPILLVFLARFFLNERTGIYQLVAIAITILGSMLLAYVDGNISGHALSGDLFAIVAAALFGIYLFIGDISRREVSNEIYTFIVYGASAIFLFALSAIVFPSAFIVTDKINYLVFLGLAIVPTLLGHSMLSLSLKVVSSKTLSVSVLGEPIIGTVLAYFLFGESFTPLKLIGIAIVMIGILTYNVFKTDKTTVDEVLNE